MRCRIWRVGAAIGLIAAAGGAAPGFAPAPAAAQVDMPPMFQRPGNCADEVKKLQASPELGVQGGGRHQQTARVSAQGYLQAAADAAARHDDKLCWRSFDLAKIALSY
ncbi:MAG TPA: hypothetical protein VGB82_27630 [Alphaproteobacteria bacterium]